jgi:hypothetical protein
MELRVNGRELPATKFGFALEKMGVGGIDLTITPEARLKVINSYTRELEKALLLAFESLPIKQAAIYLRAHDLLKLCFRFMQRKYETEYLPICSFEDSGQMTLALRTVGR